MMNNRYNDLSDEEAIELGIEFIGHEVELPLLLHEVLTRRGLLTLVTRPLQNDNNTDC